MTFSLLAALFIKLFAACNTPATETQTQNGGVKDTTVAAAVVPVVDSSKLIDRRAHV